MNPGQSFNPLLFFPPAMCDMTATSIMYVGESAARAWPRERFKVPDGPWCGWLSVVQTFGFLSPRLWLQLSTWPALPVSRCCVGPSSSSPACSPSPSWAGAWLPASGSASSSPSWGWWSWGSPTSSAGTAVTRTKSAKSSRVRPSPEPRLIHLDHTCGEDADVTLLLSFLPAGDLLIIMAQIIVSVQMVLEEKFVYKHDVHPLRAVGTEGRARPALPSLYLQVPVNPQNTAPIISFFLVHTSRSLIFLSSRHVQLFDDVSFHVTAENLNLSTVNTVKHMSWKTATSDFTDIFIHFLFK